MIRYCLYYLCHREGVYHEIMNKHDHKNKMLETVRVLTPMMCTARERNASISRSPRQAKYLLPWEVWIHMS